MSDSLKTPILRGPQFYKFSDCFLDTVERRLFKKNNRLDVTPKALEVLQVLVENAGDVISKDDLLNQIWGDSFVEEGNLAVQISKLRTLLKASKDEPYIVTESGVGYKFVSRVIIVDDDEWADLIENELAQRKNGKQKYSSVAIMPLFNESGEEEVEYLADGITESLINSLSLAKDLRVIARNTVFQFKNSEIDVKKLGRKLRVATILTGRIRIVRDNIVIAVELSKVSDGTQIWGTHLNEPFDDIFEVQEKLSSGIAEELEHEVTSFETSKGLSAEAVNLDAYRLYLKGKFFRRKGGLENLSKAIEIFQHASAIEPTFAEIYFEMAQAYFSLSAYEILPTSKVRKMIERMLEQVELLQGNKARLLYLRAIIEASFRHDFNRAIKLFEQSLEHDTTSLLCNSRYANLLVNIGKTSEALHIAQKMIRLDPIASDNIINICRIFYKAERFEAAVILLEESLELDPVNYESMVLLAANLIEMGRLADAHLYIDKALAIQENLEVQALKCYAYAKAGDLRNMKSILASFEKRNESDSKVPDTYFAFIYSELGDFDLAFGHIEQSIKNYHLDIMSLRVDPRLANLRQDDRFKLCLDRIGI